MSDLSPHWSRRLSMVWSLLATLWFAMAILWASSDELAHAAFNVLVGGICWHVGEMFRSRS